MNEFDIVILKATLAFVPFPNLQYPLWNEDLKQTTRCLKAASKVRSILGIIKSNFRRIDAEDFLVIYKAYVRPHLEYCVQTWSAHLQKDILVLEKIQRSATKTVHCLKHLCCTERLKKKKLG